MIRFTIAFCLAVILAWVARAEPPTAPKQPAEDECASTYEERLADAKRGLALYLKYMDEYEKARPTLEWFEAHCRFLSELELAVRKLDDPNAFVCDPSANGRPRDLTSELVLKFSTLPDQMSFQTLQGQNHMCESKDAKLRSKLTFHNLTKEQMLEVICRGNDGPSCALLRAMIAKKQKQKP
jgi:hypothetical protein